ncbi:MAG TPA: alpha-hydroxy acid oxidase [Vicinamibacterales bacterium]|jgi:isopentenyl diphosphate isomerase/L-lactate dehydrogenase-like FMN-dependent dehydrogenase|nr:alpha-hydroxy acid oxidase [Vicinamibacterales bacterium]
MRSDRSLARSVAFPRVINIDDFRRVAKKRLPAVVFAYIDGGAEDEITLRENVAAFADVSFRPRNCVAVPSCDLRTTVLGETFDLPFLLAPVGFCRMFYPKGELHAARAANEAGSAYILSTFSGTRLEEVRQGTNGTLWFQLYVPGGRDVAEATIARAKAAGYKVLVVTIDTPVSGMRERDFRHGVRPILQGDIWGSLPYAWQFVTRPRWVVDYFADGRPKVFPNVELPGKGAMPCGDVGVLLESTIVTWEDLRWMRDAWQGPIVVKGVHTGDDARHAIDAGAEAVVVSNHGGRQLDGVPATLRALPEVLEAVSGRVEVLMDGGIRRGGDIVKAICLGAKAVLVGRAYAWALGAAGGPGVARAIEILRTDLIRTMRLLGCGSIRDLDQSYLSANTRHDCR